MPEHDQGSSHGLPFAIAMRGYDREQVAEFFARTDAELRVIAADRDAAAANARELAEHLDDARDEIEQLRREVDSLSVPVTTAQGMSDRISRMLQLAADEASEMRATAQAEAAEVLSVARQEAAQLREESAEEAAAQVSAATAEAQRLRGEAARLEADARAAHDENATFIAERTAAMEHEHSSTMDAAKKEAERIVANARAEAQELDAQARRDRERTQEDFDVTMAARRDKAVQAVKELELTSEATARDLVDNARAQSERLLAQSHSLATERVTRSAELVQSARQLRSRMLAQLSEVRSQLDELPRLLAELEGEDDLVSLDSTELLNQGLSQDAQISRS
ncbi:DivIVA domain-containing protein [Williamsia deligens]|uniref:DivIVA domain-containing protein n=1 Tax=Williamsia deligens TaxID=321325 RepID=A0ABW3GD06_9NOCA|nr:DivIVA domain-containing protein [Williamsia deligens]MCP2195671.1 DivIVA protein [Williamsia deligens]